MTEPALETCTTGQLATLVREYLMAGHLIDRAGMPYVIAELGQDAMRDVAIGEWMGASPLYTKRMQRALRFEGDTVETIFKGMQFDVGAPPQFLDFRYRVHDDQHGEFWLDHCGALADVEPMGEDYVHTMCHDIEDPTFDATAIASNPRARVRPIHRPPRQPADRVPVCHWTVTIDADTEPLPTPGRAERLAARHAATFDLDRLAPIDHTEPGRHDYAGPLLADIRFDDFSPSALRRLALELCLQGHLLSLSFLDAVREVAGGGAGANDNSTTDDPSTDDPTTDDTNELARRLTRRQCTGVAGVVAQRLQAALGLGGGLDDAARLLALHPALLPSAYTGAEVTLTDRLLVRFDRRAPAVADGGWLALLDAQHLEPLDAAVWAVDSRLRCAVVPSGGNDDLVVEIVHDDEPRSMPEEMTLTRLSTGAEFAFADRGTPVEVRDPRQSSKEIGPTSKRGSTSSATRSASSSSG
jgi:hypothetical protein